MERVCISLCAGLFEVTTSGNGLCYTGMVTLHGGVRFPIDFASYSLPNVSIL